MFFDTSKNVVNGASAEPDPAAGTAVPVGLLSEIQAVQPGGSPTARIELALDAPIGEGIVVDLWLVRETSADASLFTLPSTRFTLREAGIAVAAGASVSRAIPRGGKVYVRVVSETVSADRILYLAGAPDQAGVGSAGAASNVTIVGTPNVNVTTLPAPKGAAGPNSLASMANAANTLALSQYLAADPTLTNTQLLLPRVDVAGYSLFKSPQLPTALGQTAKAAAISVVLASDDHQKGVGAAQSLAAAAEAANVIALGRYNATAPTLTDGQMLPMQLDVNGNLKGVEQYAPNNENSVLSVQQTQILPIVSPTFAWSTFTSAALAISQVIKAAPGSLKSFSILIDAAAAAQAWYIQFWDNTTFAAGVLRASFKVRVAASVDATKDYTFGAGGIYFGTGIVVGVSANPYTISGGSAHMSVQALEYK